MLNMSVEDASRSESPQECRRVAFENKGAREKHDSLLSLHE